MIFQPIFASYINYLFKYNEQRNSKILQRHQRFWFYH